MVTTLDIAGRRVGPHVPCFIIAEVGVNHNGSLTLARQLVDVAVEAGADAVKFQSFHAEQLASPAAPKASYQLQTTDQTESQLEMLQRLELSEDSQRTLRTYCTQRGICFLSTPFEPESADFLDDLGVPAFKIPSGEVTYVQFLRHIARKGKPMIVSTGMCTLSEVDTAVQTIREAGNEQIVLLHCVSSYPADPAEANLRAMRTMADRFDVPVGYSDHTPGIDVALAAVALGACVIEKHLTLDHALPGPDHKASLEPAEFVALVRGIRTVESALGDGRKEPTTREADTAAVARKSLVAAQDIAEGSLLTEPLIAVKRPGTGLPPIVLSEVVGRRARRPIPAGTLLSWEMVT